MTKVKIKNINEAKSDAINKGIEESKKRLKDMHIVKTTKGDIDMDYLKRELDTAKIALISESPFFAPFVNTLYDVWTFDVNTAATDGIRLFMNPVFINSLDWEQKVFLVAHELMHNILRHLEREKLGNFDHKLFNKAGDYEINAALEDEIFDKGITKSIGGLIDYNFLGLPAEKIYDMLPKENSNNQQIKSGTGAGNDSENKNKGKSKSGSGDGTNGDSGDSDNDDQNGNGNSGNGNGDSIDGNDAEGKKIRKETTDLGGSGVYISKELGDQIAQRAGDGTENELGDAANQDPKEVWDKTLLKNKDALGHGTGSLGKLINDIVISKFKPQINWKSLLRKYMTAIFKTSELRLGNKKYLNNDYYRYYEKNFNNSINEIIFLIDVSGSVVAYPDILNSIATEATYIGNNIKIKTTYYVTFDDGITGVQKLGIKSKPSFDFKGSGGTNFSKAFNWVDKNIKDPKKSIVIMFTDGDAPIPNKPNWDKKLIWVIYNNENFKAGYGKILNIDTSNFKL